MPLATANVVSSAASASPKAVADRQRAERRERPVYEHAVGDVFRESFDRLGEGRKQQRVVQPACIKLPDNDDRDKDGQALHCVVVDDTLDDGERALHIADDARVNEIDLALGPCRVLLGIFGHAGTCL